MSQTMGTVHALTFTFCLIVAFTHNATAQGVQGSACSVQSDCGYPLSCIAFNDKEIYSMIGVIRPSLPCETSGKTDCLCAQPSTVTGDCDEFSECDPSVSCSTFSDCSDSKLCYAIDTESGFLEDTPCTSDDDSCTCIRPDSAVFKPCGSTSADCGDGERCAKLEELYSFKCIACDLAPGLDITVLEYPEDSPPSNCDSEPAPAPPSPSASPSEAPPSTSSVPSVAASSPDAPSPSAVATEATPLGPSPDAPVASTSAAASASPQPVSVTDETPAAPTPSSSSAAADEADPEVCIDAAALAHLPSHQLIFSEHRRAAVLCDSFGSCATPGHMVEHHGVPMTMLSYCARSNVECTKTIKMVNSPKMTAGLGLRIKSRSDGLVYTSLAARYQTKTEEWMLSKLLRMGA